MQIGSKKQRGMTLVELAVVPALVVILMMVSPIYADFQRRNVEISATAYDQLSSIAKMSCSGETYLKSIPDVQWATTADGGRLLVLI